jgi:2-polyprenyl-3-methyl-5-hydroxy-6-metoxy-1,4-benzoquinol methylase
MKNRLNKPAFSAFNIVEVLKRFRGYVPFTALNLLRRFLGNSNESLLDIGCGKGQPAKFLTHDKNMLIIGADVHRPYLEYCKAHNTHSDYVQCDVRNSPFAVKSFDAVLCKEVIEHLSKEEAEKLINEIENIARKQVFITTPVGTYKQTEYDENPFQEHVSTWMPEELRQLDYEVRGVGFRNMLGERGLEAKLPRAFKWFGDVAYVLAGPIVYYFPRLACFVVCVKNLDFQRSKTTNA